MITTDQIDQFWKRRFRAELRNKGDKIAAEVQIHSRKLAPDTILDAFRPNETDRQKQYRKSVYQPRTYGTFQKVLQQFVKIRRAEDWRVEWPTQTVNNPLRDYTQQNFGEYTTLENWYFTYYIRNVIDDPNGALIWLPANIEAILMGERLDPTQPFKPIPFYFPSSAVREYTQDLLVIDAREPVRDAQGRQTEGVTVEAMYLFDKDEAVKLVMNGGNQNRTYSEYRYQHGLGFTAVQNGGLLLDADQRNNRVLYDSFISPALPFWADAIAIESDHKINLALHIYPERWELATRDCTNRVGLSKCNGGKIKLQQGRGFIEVDCAVCSGTGQVASRSPQGRFVVSPLQAGMNKMEMPPMPPAGYLERPVEAIKVIKELADGAVFDGLAALNLENLVQTPLNISGNAKELDRQETETYITLVSDWSIDQILANAYYFMARWLLPGQSDEQLKAYLPSINKPRKFDLVTTDAWAARVAAYKKDGAAASTQGQAEIKLAERQYGPESGAFKKIRDSIDLDPLYGQTADEKEVALLGGGCSREDYIISTKIGYFLTRAINEDKGFYDKDFKHKADVLLKYAQELSTPVPTGAGAALGGQQADGQTGDQGDPRASLRGSVGGSGIIRQLRVDVAQGLATMDAAVAQIVEQLGYSEETARKMLGEPVNLKDKVKTGEVTPAAAAGA